MLWPTEGVVRAPDPEIVVIVIGSPASTKELAKTLESRHGARCLSFDSLCSFDEWRSNPSQGNTIQNEVMDALREAGVPIISMADRLRTIFVQMLREIVTPEPDKLASWAGSRRTLYRWWGAELSISPAQFLRRVRTLHAERLLRSGLRSKEAAFRAGYSSPSAMSREISRKNRSMARSD